MTSDTRQFVIKLFSIAIVVFCAAILATLLYRAWIDGNAPLTSQITSGLIGLLPWLLGFLGAIIIGEPVGTSLVARALPILFGGVAGAASGVASGAASATPPVSAAASSAPPVAG